MNRKVLVVDNHPMLLKFVSQLLGKKGYQVRTAEDGLAALDILKSYFPEFIFVDLIMPEIDGEQLCRIIRSRPALNNAYIIIQSGAAAEQEIDLAALGANAAIAKGPLDKMADHILQAMNRLQQGEDLSDEVLGRDDVFPRELTRELLSNRRHSKVILDNMMEGILELSRKSRIVYANHAAMAMLNVSEEKLLGSQVDSVFNGPESVQIKKILSGKKLEEPVYLAPPVRLNEKQIILRLLPVRDPDFPSLLLIMTDITERKLAEAQALEAQKLKAVSTLVGGIAHEFNNALFGISGNLELIQMETSSDETLREHLPPIRTSIARMTTLTAQLLAYGQRRKPKLQDISLNGFVADCLTLIRYTITPTITVETDLEEPSLLVKMDPTQMQMVFSGVIANAVESIEPGNVGRSNRPSGGRIGITVKPVQIDQTDKRREHLQPGFYALLRLSDDGQGMDETTKSRGFEPFFTTKFQGRGLGMASVYGIVKQHQGWTTIDSRPGKGTIVDIYLPASRSEGG